MYYLQALIGLAFSIGFMAGPLAGAWFAKTSDGTSGGWGERPAFYALSLALANIILVMFFIPETLEKVAYVFCFSMSGSLFSTFLEGCVKLYIRCSGFYPHLYPI